MGSYRLDEFQDAKEKPMMKKDKVFAVMEFVFHWKKISKEVTNNTISHNK